MSHHAVFALSFRKLVILPVAMLAIAATAACNQVPEDEEVGESAGELTSSQKMPRYARIRDAAAARGIKNAYLLAGIGNDETGLAHCWSEATWACKGPSSPDCGGGPVIAGSADGPCGAQQGGLGMFQFDSGTFTQTLNAYGPNVLTIDGQVQHVINYVIRMVRDSIYTTNAETDDKARAWLNNFDLGNGALRDQWIRTVVRYYNGCQPGWSCWGPRYQTYSDGLNHAVSDTNGLAFWAAGTSCPTGSGTTMGAIDAKYRALGGCGSILGVPKTDERMTPDNVGRYTVFDRGSIYWTPQTGAHEVHGVIRDRWAAVGWETGPLGYPITDETPAPDGVGRYNVFEHGSIYWTPETGAHEVHGVIRDRWAVEQWETGPLGYPTSGEYEIPGGRKNDFQHGAIIWTAATNETSVQMAGEEEEPAPTADGGTN
jgi:hypothetical protein